MIFLRLSSTQSQHASIAVDPAGEPRRGDLREHGGYRVGPGGGLLDQFIGGQAVRPSSHRAFWKVYGQEPRALPPQLQNARALGSGKGMHHLNELRLPIVWN